MAIEQTGTVTPALATAVPNASEAVGPGKQKRGVRLPAQFGAYAVVLLVSFVSLFPLYWMVINSFRLDADITSGVTLWPDGGVFHFSNYSTAWNGLGLPFQVFLINSFMLSIMVVIGTVISCTLVAYGFARFRFPGRGALFAIVISTMMIPYVVTLIPQYAEFIDVFHWGGGLPLLYWSDFAQFLPQFVPAFFASPVWIFLLRQFIRSIPFDLDEAAKIDGAGPLRILWKIIVPEIRPALAAVIVLNFIGKWNDLLGPLIYLKNIHNYTIEVALLGYESRYSTGTNWGELMAMSLITIIPIVVVYFFASKQIIQGVTLSGVKG